MIGRRTLLIVVLFFFLPWLRSAPWAQSTVDAPWIFQVKTFPIDAALAVVDTSGRRIGNLAPRGWNDLWRNYQSSTPPESILVTADGHRSRELLVPPGASPPAAEVRLLPNDGPLQLVAELPTGDSPKSVAFLPQGQLVVPLLRGPGIDVFQLTTDRWGQTQVEPQGRVAPPAPAAGRSGFVEPLVDESGGRLWVSQMLTDQLHAFALSDLSYQMSVPSGGRWPKVIAGDEDRQRLLSTNWLGQSLSLREDRGTGELVAALGLGEVPRGLAVDPATGTAWVCLFTSGDILVVDLDTLSVMDRLSLGPGSARHIVVHPTTRRAYYSDMYNATVTALDLDTREILVRRQVGINLNTIAVDPAGRYLYVSERGPNGSAGYLYRGPVFGRIFVLDLDDLSVVQTIWAGHQPTGLAVSPDGRFVAATDFLDDNLSVYSVMPATKLRN